MVDDWDTLMNACRGQHRMLAYPFSADEADSEMVVLLTLSSDSRAKMTWGDEQCRYFCIDRDDLAARRFQKVRVIPALG